MKRFSRRSFLRLLGLGAGTAAVASVPQITQATPEAVSKDLQVTAASEPPVELEVKSATIDGNTLYKPRLLIYPNAAWRHDPVWVDAPVRWSDTVSFRVEGWGWTCNHCGNRNTWRRQDCETCGGPRRV